MKLTLIIKEEKKIFNLPEFIPARLIRQAPELADIPNNPGPEDMDKMVQYVVKFTVNNLHWINIGTVWMLVNFIHNFRCN